jgi:hypothetical protein
MEDVRHEPPMPWLEDASYTASYCEENVYLLLKSYMAMTHGAIYVVFVSNPNKSVSPHGHLLLTVPHVDVGHARSFSSSPELARNIWNRGDSRLFGIIT